MLTLYLVCLIVGGSMVALSVFAGADADADLDTGGGMDAGGAPDLEGAEVAAVASHTRLVSVRNAVFVVAFFGLGGTLFTMLGLGPLLTPPLAVASGLAAGASIHALMRHLAGKETGAVEDPASFAGRMARVVVGIDEGHSGKIVLLGGDRTLHLVARVHDGAGTRRFRPGDEVVIIDVDGAVARIAEAEFLATA